LTTTFYNDIADVRRAITLANGSSFGRTDSAISSILNRIKSRWSELGSPTMDDVTLTGDAVTSARNVSDALTDVGEMVLSNVSKNVTNILSGYSGFKLNTLRAIADYGKTQSTDSVYRAAIALSDMLDLLEQRIPGLKKTRDADTLGYTNEAADVSRHAESVVETLHPESKILGEANEYKLTGDTLQNFPAVIWTDGASQTVSMDSLASVGVAQTTGSYQDVKDVHTVEVAWTPNNAANTNAFTIGVTEVTGAMVHVSIDWVSGVTLNDNKCSHTVGSTGVTTFNDLAVGTPGGSTAASMGYFTVGSTNHYVNWGEQSVNGWIKGGVILDLTDVAKGSTITWTPPTCGTETDGFWGAAATDMIFYRLKVSSISISDIDDLPSATFRGLTGSDVDLDSTTTRRMMIGRGNGMIMELVMSQNPYISKVLGFAKRHAMYLGELGEATIYDKLVTHWNSIRSTTDVTSATLLGSDFRSGTSRIYSIGWWGTNNSNLSTSKMVSMYTHFHTVLYDYINLALLDVDFIRSGQSNRRS
jgi:hypothetical protein